MARVCRFVARRRLEFVLMACLAHLAWLIYAVAYPLDPNFVPLQRIADYPDTYIGQIHVNLTGPDHYVHLTWAGPNADQQDIGPFRSSPGAGWGNNDCNDSIESNCPDSRCTPIGLRKVEGFLDQLRDTPEHRYVTLIDARRSIGFHSSFSVPPYPASQGCVRLEPYAARLIHDNSIRGVTEILIDGTWTNPNRYADDRKD